MTSRRNKILIIKISALGDVCLAMPHIDVILEHHKNDDIWILTSPSFTVFFQNHPGLRVVTIDRSKLLAHQSKWRRMLWVRRQQFDVLYDLQGNRTSRQIARFSGAGIKIGTQPYDVFDFHPQGMYTIKTQQSIFDRLNETLQAASLPPAAAKCRIHHSNEDIDRVENWISEHGLAENRFVLLHAGCSPEWPSKRWPEKNFTELAQRMEARGLKCVWIGGSEDAEINARLAAETGIDATQCFTLLQLHLLGERALFGVTNDSGPMHILAISGLAVYSFFGPTSWVRSQAAGQGRRVLQNNTPCSPCFLKKCPPDKGHVCLQNISVDTVIKKISSEFPL